MILKVLTVKLVKCEIDFGGVNMQKKNDGIRYLSFGEVNIPLLECTEVTLPEMMDAGRSWITLKDWHGFLTLLSRIPEKSLKHLVIYVCGDEYHVYDELSLISFKDVNRSVEKWFDSEVKG